MPFERWRLTTLTRGFAEHEGLSEKEARATLKDAPALMDAFVTENAKSVIQLARPDYDNVGHATRDLIDRSTRDSVRIFRLERDGFPDIYLIGGKRILFYSDKLKLIDGKYVTGEPLTTIWDDVLSNNIHNEGGVAFPKGKKPEALIKRVLDLTTSENDWVLDSFAGSGTTGAVAQKMGRRWIMVELGEHCQTHVIPRLKKVIDGQDHGGITEALEWKGGGGFRYYRLAPSLLKEDKWGNWVISKEYNAGMLAEALCKLEGFIYAPSYSVYWQQGHSTERDYLYVTTAQLNHDQLQQLSDEVGPERSLLVLCTAFRGRTDRYPNLTVKKIPKQVLSRCEWGHDDYSLQVENLPKAPPKMGQQALFGEEEGQ
jgi:adenine-specific DNA-methyltransferase